jgi:hypothetical protein
MRTAAAFSSFAIVQSDGCDGGFGMKPLKGKPCDATVADADNVAHRADFLGRLLPINFRIFRYQHCFMEG